MKFRDLISKLTVLHAIQALSCVIPIEKSFDSLLGQRIIDLVTHRPSSELVQYTEKPLVGFAVFLNPFDGLIILGYVQPTIKVG